jgi:predicted nuclease of predicted toxin-antitoxin system
MHKLLFDQNLSFRIIKNIVHQFPESTHVRLIKLDQADDLTVWEYSKKNGFHIVTQDSDYNDINTLNGYPPKIIRITTGNSTTKKIIELILNKSDLIHDFLDNEKNGYLEIE